MTTTTYPSGQQLSSTALTQAQIDTIVQQVTLAMLGFTAILSVVPHSGAAGAGYASGDQPQAILAGATGGLLSVTAVGGSGNVVSLQPAAPNQGKGWLTGQNFATSGGSGTGLAVDVTFVGTSSSASAVRMKFPVQGAPFSEASEDVCYLRCETSDNEYDRIRERFMQNGAGDLVEELQNYTRTWRLCWTFYGPNSADNARMVRSGLCQDYFTNLLANDQLFPVSEYREPVRAPEVIDGQWFDRSDFDAVAHEWVTETISDPTVLSVEVIGNDDSGTIFDVTVTS